MKNYLKFNLCALTLFLFVTACSNEEYNDATFEYVGLASNRLPSTIFEGTGEFISEEEVEFRYGNNVNPGRSFEVTVSTSGTAQLGEDYLVEGANVSGSEFTLTMDAESPLTSVNIVTVSNDVQNENLSVIWEITSTTEGVSIGYPYSDTYEFTILDDDCPYDFDLFVGTASVMEPSYGPYDAEVIEVGPNRIQTQNFWDTGGLVTMILVPCDGTVDVPSQDWTYSDSSGDYPATVSGSGTWDDETGILEVTFDIGIPEFEFESNDETHVFTFTE